MDLCATLFVGLVTLGALLCLVALLATAVENQESDTARAIREINTASSDFTGTIDDLSDEFLRDVYNQIER